MSDETMPVEDTPEIEGSRLRDPIHDVDIKTTVGEIKSTIRDVQTVPETLVDYASAIVDPALPNYASVLERIRDQTMPDGAWAFDAEVTEAFDDMLERSIPQYEVMRTTVVDVLDSLLTRTADVHPKILDLGTSRGEMLQRLVNRFGASARFVGNDVSEPMLEAARDRFKLWTDYVEIVSTDLRTSFPTGRFDAIVSSLTLQFVPIEYREKIVSAAYDSLEPGGVFILVEKVLGEGSLIDEKMVEIYLRMKEQNGYPREAIDRKRLALEGVLVPITAKWNEDLLATAGFRHVDCFWRWMNFAGWVAVK